MSEIRMVRLNGDFARSVWAPLAELPTKNAARNKLTELLGGESRPTVVDMTFKELVERWEKAEGPTIKSASLLHYRNALRMYVMPAFGRQTISAITREGIQKFLADKAKTYSRSALRSMRTVLSLTLGWGFVLRLDSGESLRKDQTSTGHRGQARDSRGSHANADH